MNRHLSDDQQSAGAVSGSAIHCGISMCTGSVLGSALLALAILAAPVGALLTSQAVMAQQDTLLEEIIVTARKREENVLEIPESLTTFSGNLVESANINGLEDISLLVPNLWMSRRLDGFPNVSIRGLGAFGNTQGVGFYLDDVQLFGDASSRFGNFERIEVLKGPQGILYGGANIGGAIKFVTKRPDPEAFSGRVKAQAGEDNYYDGEIQLNVPLGNDWALALFGFAMTDDSFLVNPNSPRLNGGVTKNDPDVGKTEKYGVRAALAGNISEQLSVYATLRYNELDGPNNIWNRELTSNLTHHNIVDTSYNPRHERETIAGSIELTYDFGNFSATYLTSYTDTESDRQTDLDISQEFMSLTCSARGRSRFGPRNCALPPRMTAPCNGRPARTTWTIRGIMKRTFLFPMVSASSWIPVAIQTRMIQSHSHRLTRILRQVCSAAFLSSTAIGAANRLPVTPTSITV